MATKDKGKAAITAIEYSASDRAMLFSFYNHPQPLWVWADGTSISFEKSNLHMDVGWGVQANIKGKVRSPKKGLGKKAKNQGLPDRIEEKDSSSEHGLNLYEHYDKPPFGDQGLAFQTHALQIILFGPFLRANPISFCSRYKLSHYNIIRIFIYFIFGSLLSCEIMNIILIKYIFENTQFSKYLKQDIRAKNPKFKISDLKKNINLLNLWKL